MPTTNPRLGITLKPDTREAIQNYADQLRIPASRLVTQILEDSAENLRIKTKIFVKLGITSHVNIQDLGEEIANEEEQLVMDLIDAEEAKTKKTIKRKM